MTLRASVVLTLAALTLVAAQVDYLGSPCTGEICENGMLCLSLAGGNCTWDGWNLGPFCTCGGVGGDSDPYFTGFSGQSFYYKAEADNVYNIFSHQDHLVNAHFVATEMPQESDLLSVVTGSQNSSFIGTIAFQHRNVTVEVSADRNAWVTVKVNGEEFNLGDNMTDLEVQLFLDNEVTVKIDKYPVLPRLGTSVRIESRLLGVSIFPEGVHNDNMGNKVRGHLSVELSLSDDTVDAHGILGQTLDAQVTSQEVDTFPGEGNASDYIVSSLFAYDFPFNRYGEPPRQRQSQPTQPVPVLSSRRLLKGRSDTNQHRQLVASYSNIPLRR